MALCGLAVTLVVFPVVALLIKLTSKGPIIYTQTRLGLNGNTFSVIKFRTMIADAEHDGQAVWAQENDPRITRVGGILRRLYIDELPQWINVLRGEMSAVGPRPERPEIAEEITRNLAKFQHRLGVKPGITGLAQLNRGYTQTMDHVVGKLALDLLYVRHATWWMDTKLVVRTILTVLKYRGT